MVISVYQKIWWLKNYIQCEYKSYKISIHLQIELEIALFSKSILSVLVFQWCTVFARLWLHTKRTHTHTHTHTHLYIYIYTKWLW